MSLRLNGSTSGYTELDAGAVAGNNTIKMPTSNGSAYQVLRNGATAGTTEFGGAIVSGTAVASTSGTSIDFTGIPSWVKRITVALSGFSTSGTSNFLVQGGSGSIENTSYNSNSVYSSSSSLTTTSTAGFVMNYGAFASASTIINGTMTLVHIGSNIWVESHTMGSNGGAGFMGAGQKSFSGVIDRIRISTVNGTDTFDAGTINILYE